MTIRAHHGLDEAVNLVMAAVRSNGGRARVSFGPRRGGAYRRNDGIVGFLPLILVMQGCSPALLDQFNHRHPLVDGLHIVDVRRAESEELVEWWSGFRSEQLGTDLWSTESYHVGPDLAVEMTEIRDVPEWWGAFRLGDEGASA